VFREKCNYSIDSLITNASQEKADPKVINQLFEEMFSEPGSIKTKNGREHGINFRNHNLSRSQHQLPVFENAKEI
jgi:hypothetical protein